MPLTFVYCLQFQYVIRADSINKCLNMSLGCFFSLNETAEPKFKGDKDSEGEESNEENEPSHPLTGCLVPPMILFLGKQL